MFPWRIPPCTREFQASIPTEPRLTEFAHDAVAEVLHMALPTTVVVLLKYVICCVKLEKENKGGICLAGGAVQPWVQCNPLVRVR